MTTTNSAPPSASDELPRWSVADVHDSLDTRSFVDDLEGVRADVARTVVLFDELGVRATDERVADATDGRVADQAIVAWNDLVARLEVLQAVVYATVATDSRDERAQALLSELGDLDAQVTPLLARLAEWVRSVRVSELSRHSEVAAQHRGPLERLAARADHQMSEDLEGFHAELATTGTLAWARLQRDITSQLSGSVRLPDGRVDVLPMPAVRGLATHRDVAVRQAAYRTELETWPTVATSVGAAMNAVKGAAIVVDRRRHWASPLDASLFANSVAPDTFRAMQSAVVDALPDFRRWMRAKAALHGHAGGLPWWDLVAPAPTDAGAISWEAGVDIVRDAFGEYSPGLGALVDRALDERWIDAAPRDGKTGGAFCMPFVNGRSLVLLNWSGSLESTQTTAHELGHAYHNTTLAERTPLQRRLPMALAETASIFCETLVVEAGLARLDGADRLALLDVDLQGANQVIVDIHSRFLFETEVFARRSARTLGVGELDELMLTAQDAAYGDGLDQETAHRSMWILKPHYYGSHYYNWPYTYGLLFGLGLFARYREDPERFRSGYETLLSRAGMDSAETLGAAFGLDVTTRRFWDDSLDVLRARIDEYATLAATVTRGDPDPAVTRR